MRKAVEAIRLNPNFRHFLVDGVVPKGWNQCFQPFW